MDDISRAYDRWSAVYDDDHNTTRDLDAAVLRASDLVLAGRDVVELGAGTGKNTAWLAAQAARVTALDFSEGMLARARDRLTVTNVRWIRADLRERWPLDAASADVVVGNLVLEHIEDCAFVFAETARVLRRGGEAYFAELHPGRQRLGSQAQFTDPTTHARIRVPAFVHSVGEFEEAATRAGLSILSFEDYLEPEADTAALPRLLVMRFRIRIGDP
jgi:malonyl-CoA O-methyltransferase